MLYCTVNQARDRELSRQKRVEPHWRRGAAPTSLAHLTLRARLKLRPTLSVWLPPAFWHHNQTATNSIAQHYPYRSPIFAQHFLSSSPSIPSERVIACISERKNRNGGKEDSRRKAHLCRGKNNQPPPIIVAAVTEYATNFDRAEAEKVIDEGQIDSLYALETSKGWPYTA